MFWFLSLDLQRMDLGLLCGLPTWGTLALVRAVHDMTEVKKSSNKCTKLSEKGTVGESTLRVRDSLQKGVEANDPYW